MILPGHLMDFNSSTFQFIYKSGSGSTIVITALATLAAVTVSNLVFRQKRVKIIKGPTSTLLPYLNQAEREALPYPPDALPGGRDVDSAYGTIRVYEWGREEGRKVLLVHGLTTSCLTLGAIAHGLVERGCRVMLFDLWGRGYSDSCADLPHDERLYSTQIFLAIASSRLPWTGEAGFSLLGYSLGGGISASFASYFPNLVNSLVLLAPVGLIREERVARQTRIFSIVSLLPGRILESIFRRRLRSSLFPAVKKNSINIEEISQVAAAESVRETESIPHTKALSSLRYPNITEFQATQWGIRVNAGFFNSFLSSLSHFPGTSLHESWKRLNLLRGKTLIFGGSSDPIVNAEELKEDSIALLGSDKLEWRLTNGAHDFPVTDPDRIVREIWLFWKM